MKVVLFCGGQGLRLREAGSRTPKPLMPVGGDPILLHLMRYYAHFGHTDFVLCLGYEADAFRRFFAEHADPAWTLTMVDTGPFTNVGGRLAAVREHVAGEEHFLANYADQLSDAPLPDLVDRVRAADAVGGALCVKPTYSTHVVSFGDDGLVTSVDAMNDGSLWINGGFFVFRHDVFDHMREGEELVEEPFARLIANRQLLAHRHDGFWAPMDTMKDKQALDALAESSRPPWAVWLDEPVAPKVVPMPVAAPTPRAA
jgi:glucose-1-phosphate cytidylyltransferase